MRLIRIDKVSEVFNEMHGDNSFDEWLRLAEVHLDKIRGMSKNERAKYWGKNNHWKELYPVLSKISDNKCWYSEAPENSSEFEIEHYRPKGKSINREGVVILENGYWWLSYHWKNLRLSGTLVNKLRKDRFEGESEVFGKGNYFPIQNESEVASPEDKICDCEIPYLIDPINARDVTLISFDKNGAVLPTYSVDSNEFQFNKAQLSIKYYGLDHTPIKRGRRKVWQNCEDLVERTQNYLKNNIGNEQRRNNELDNCYLELAKLSSSDAPYSSVIRSFIKVKSSEPNYEWLDDALGVLQ